MYHMKAKTHGIYKGGYRLRLVYPLRQLLHEPKPQCAAHSSFFFCAHNTIEDRTNMWLTLANNILEIWNGRLLPED